MNKLNQLLASTREMMERATPGPWTADNHDFNGRDYGEPIVVIAGEKVIAYHSDKGTFLKPENAEAIAVARNLTPALCRALERAVAAFESIANNQRIDADVRYGAEAVLRDIQREMGVPG